MNKKGFTMIEMLGVIVVLAIIFAIAVPLYFQYLNSARLDAFKTNENSMEVAAEDFILANNLFSGISEGEVSCVLLSTLIDENHLEDIIDPDLHGSLCDYSNSYVSIYNAGKSDFEYEAYLVCSDYSSDSLGRPVDTSVVSCLSR